MNRLTQLFFVLFLLCLPVSVMAQKDKNDDSKYLAGAVPEVDGKVVFSKEFNIPGMSQDEIFDRMMKWMETRLKENKNQGSRVAYSDKEKGIIAGVGEEWIVFKSSALSLDRTWVNYQITVTCKPEKCFMEVEKIRFTYGENEKYTAEDWISDKYALNKAKTKLIRGLAKWRRKTVDFADNLFTGAAQALGAAGVATEPVIQPGKQAVITPGPVVITPANPVIATDPSVNNNPSAANVPGYKEITPDQIPANAIQMGAGNLVVAIGKDAFNMTMMTANAGGSLGKMNGKPVVFTIFSPEQSYEQIEKADTYSVRFYPTNQSEPSIILECKKLPSQTPMEGQPRTYSMCQYVNVPIGCAIMPHGKLAHWYIGTFIHY